MRMSAIRWLSSALALALAVLPAGAETATFPARSGSGAGVTAWWQGKVCPGDAVFVRLALGENAPSGKIGGSLEFEKDGKKVGTAEFYEVPDSSGRGRRMALAGIPLSSYLSAGKGTATARLTAGGAEISPAMMPIEIVAKEFVKETIQLDAANTAIKTNDSDERWRQINKLNKILGTRTDADVFSLAPMLPPTGATRRTSFFADRRIFAYSNGKSSTSLHYGIDYGIPTGSKVRSCAAGKVVLAEMRITTGWSIVIEHLPGLYSLYYHLSKMDVGVGDMVSAGQQIALSGATGLATGPHLHWEMRLNMEAVSPDFFTGDFTFEEAVRNP